MNQTVIVYGPQGCGKTRGAEKLMKLYGKTVLIDEGEEPPLKWKEPFPLNALVLTSNAQAARKHSAKFGSLAIMFMLKS